VTQSSWAPDTLEELVAPIALYPDQLLGQILAASVNSQEVLDAGNWLLQNESLKADALDAAAQKAGFGPAMRALVQFPSVVDMMCQQIDWTRQLGGAFTSDQKGVLDAVQRLRAQAAAVGNLKSTPQQTVETHKESDKVVVEVKPATPQVVYVPQYDPQVVYTTPPPAAPAPTQQADTVSTGTAVAASLLAFGVGVALGNAMHDDDNYYPHWGAGAVYCGPRPFYPPAYVYRPAYGPAFHPASRYVPPPGYRHNYNNVNVNVNRNTVVNNNNYYNRFNNNQNLRVDQTRSPLAQANAPRAARAEDWKGQSTYAGAKSGQHAAQLKQPATDRNLARQPDTAQRVPRQPGTAQNLARAYGSSTRQAHAVDPPAARNADASRPASRDTALDGAGRAGGGSFDRAASARGHASSGTHQARVGARR